MTYKVPHGTLSFSSQINIQVDFDFTFVWMLHMCSVWLHKIILLSRTMKSIQIFEEACMSFSYLNCYSQKDTRLFLHFLDRKWRSADDTKSKQEFSFFQLVIEAIL